MVVAELDGRTDGHGGFHDQRLAAHHLHLRQLDGVDVFLLERLAVDFRDEAVERFLEERVVADLPFEHGAGRLAAAEAGHVRALDDATVGGIERLFEPLGLYLDLQHNLALGNCVPWKPSQWTSEYNYSMGVIG